MEGGVLSTAANASDETGRGEVARWRAVLAEVPLFSALDAGSLDRTIASLELRPLEAGQWCMRRGDPPDGLYVLATGRLETVVDGTRVAEIGRGEVFGEISMLTGEARTAGVRAVRDSEVLVLPADAFDELAQVCPGVVRHLSQIVIGRLRRTEQAKDRNPSVRTIGLLGGCDGGTGALVGEVADALAGALGAHAPTALVGPDDAPERPAWTRWSHDLEASSRFVLYRADPATASWARWCMRQSDRILLVADAHRGSPARLLQELAALRGHTTGGAPRAVVPDPSVLLLVHDRSVEHPEHAARWVGTVPAGAHLNVRRGDASHMARAARLCTDRGVGLVLGGGGPRGLAHIGVLQALEEAGVPVDAVGGTSIGALIGSVYALGSDAASCQARALGAIDKAGRLFPPTPPIVSLTSPRKLHRLLEHPEMLGPWLAETTWLPTFCVSANLTRAEVVVHDRGRLATSVRASLAIPGILPPVKSGDDLLVDGGVLNNLPTDVMRSRPGIGTVVAVDVGVDVEMGAPGDYREGASGWELLGERIAERLMRGGGATNLPSALHIMFRAKDLAARRIQMDLLERNRPDLLVRPPVVTSGMFDFAGSRHLIHAARTDAASQLVEAGWTGRRW